MIRHLAEEIRQSTAFRSPQEEVFLALQRTADAVLRPVAEVLRAEGLSPTQYNVLRILRGAGETGLACGEVAQRMVTRDPDLTRLLDRLESRGLIERSRGARDRRVVVTRATPVALKLLATLDVSVDAAQRRALAHVRAADLRLLIRLLEVVRSPAA
jgi:DNA-binding MarR family transcriptional regulator